MNNSNEQKDKNKQLLNRLVKNLYYAEIQELSGHDVIRADNFEQALAKLQSKQFTLTTIEKLDLSENQDGKLYQVMGLLELLISAEDQNNFEGTFIHSSGDHKFTLDQLHEKTLHHMNSLDAIIEKLNEVNKKLELRWRAIELFQEELFPREEKPAA